MNCYVLEISNLEETKNKNEYVKNRKPDLECILKLRVANFYAGTRVAVKTKGSQLVPID